MSRRKQRPARPGPPPPAPPPPRRPGWGLAPTLGLAAGAFVLVTLIAWAAGAANLGVAAGIGQIAFAIAVVYLMVWR